MPTTTLHTLLVAARTEVDQARGGGDAGPLGAILNDATYSADLIDAVTTTTGTHPRNAAHARATLRRWARHPITRFTPLPHNRQLTLNDIDAQRARAQRSRVEAKAEVELVHATNPPCRPLSTLTTTSSDRPDEWVLFTRIISPHTNPGTELLCPHGDQPQPSSQGVTCPVCGATVTLSTVKPCRMCGDTHTAPRPGLRGLIPALHTGPAVP